VRDLAVLFLHLLATVARLAGPGGARSVVAESVLVKHQLLILNRSRKRSSNLRVSDRMVAGLCALLMRPGRLIRSAIVLKPSTLLSLHRALTQRKYRRLFSSKAPTKPGPKGPTQEVIAAVIDMKRRNPTWGCPRIAQQMRRSSSISNATTTVTERMRGWTGARRTRARTRADARMSVRIDGSCTVEGCIRHRWRRDVCATDVHLGNFQNSRRGDRLSAIARSVAA